MTLEDRLQNWGRWARGSTSKGHCGSIEWTWTDKWRAAYGADYDVNPVHQLVPIDGHDAQLIQFHVKRQLETRRLFLNARYVYRWADGRLSRAFGFPYHDLGNYLLQVTEKLQESLDTASRVGNNPQKPRRTAIAA